jgi:hypothetical protein
VLIVLVSALVAAACEHGVTLSGTITAPVEVQQAFSRERPGLVRVRTSIPKTSVLDYRVAILCEPTSGPLMLPFFHDGFGCAKEGVVRVDVLQAAAGEGLSCGAQQTLWTEATEGPVVATGAETVFEGQTGSLGCSSGADSIDVVLTLVR